MALGGLLASMSSPTLRRGLLNVTDPAAMANAQAPRPGGGGLLSGGGFLDKFNNFAGDNWETLLAMGLGGMQPTRAGSSAGMLQGLQTGADLSDRRRTRQEEQKERERLETERQQKRLALRTMLEKYPGELPPGIAQIMEIDPDFGIRWMEATKPPAGPSPTTGMQDFAAAQANPAYADFLDRNQEPQPEAPRPMTPAERQAWGITETDNRPWAMVEGKPAVLGGNSGVTVNNFPSATESQANANIYASRMEAAEPIIRQNEQQGTSLLNRGLSGIPVLGNYLVPEEYQLFNQAKQDFMRAVLRKESGAVISEEEMAGGDQMYFPQPGDGPDVIERKRQSRAAAMAAIRQATGPFQQGPGPAEPSGAEWTTLPNGVRIRQVQ
jgi:hypothetical protein